MKKLYAWPLVSLGIVVLAGCQDTNKNGLPDSPATGGQIERGINNTEKSMEKGAEKLVPAIEKGANKVMPALEKGAEKAVPVVEKTVSTGVSLASDAALSGKVKAALITDKAVDSSNIDVTTKKNVIYLQGSVTSSAQRSRAVVIARKTAGAGHTVKNALKVAAGKH